MPITVNHKVKRLKWINPKKGQKCNLRTKEGILNPEGWKLKNPISL